MVRWGIVAAAMLAASSAWAETKTLARSGSWEAFGGTTASGRGVCGISAEPGGRYFGLKLFHGFDTFTVQMGTSEWKSKGASSGAKVPLTLRYDNHPVWRATGTVFSFDDGDPGVQFDVNRSEMQNFARELRDSSTLRVVFQDNYFPAWTLGLQGTMAVNDAFQQCVRTLK